MDKAEYLEALEAESDAFLSAAAAVAADSSVSHCGDWKIADLVEHQTLVWGYATAAVKAAGQKPEPGHPKPDDESKLFEWAASVRATMLETLNYADPKAPARSFAANDQTAGFWQRRMVAETLVHRWDAEQCAPGEGSPMDPAVASDAIDEYTEVGLRYSNSRPDRTYPASSLHLHCTDTEGEWLLVGTDGPDFTVTREHAKGDAAARGTAEALLLWIWGRDGGDVEILGDAAVAQTWRELCP